MGNCAKCGKEAHFWRSVWSFKEYFPEFYGKRLCPDCITELNTKRMNSNHEKTEKTCVSCKKKFGFMNLSREWKTKAFHPEWYGQSLHYDCLVQEWSNIPKLCSNCGHYELTGTVEDEDIGSYSNSKCRKFSIALDIAGDERFTQLVAMANKCSSYINRNEYQEKCLKGEMGKEKECIQIVLDFSSLKDEMSKGGLVMTTYKCPNCSGMIDIPEAGKVLVCKYCSTPIKPVDIFEKIKTLIQ